MLFSVLIWLFCLSGCQPKNPTIKIIITSDIHYLSDSLRDDGELFGRLIAEGDGRLIHYAVPIIDAFLAQVVEEKPDALVLTGDLTFNGEKQSHIELAEKLNDVEAEGIAVYVIPGNHDINNPYARYYQGNEGISTDSVTPEEFEKIYASFGFDEALSRGKSSLSYTVSVGEKIQLYLADTNLYSPDSWSSGGMFGESQLEWAEKSLEVTKENGSLPIMFSHHNIIDHSSSLNFGYTVYDSDKVIELYKKNGAVLNFSGHIHMQNIAKTNGIYDIASGSLLINPTQYGILIVDESAGTIEYNTAKVNVGNWAEKNNFADENMENYSDYNYQFFWQSAYDKFYAKLCMIDTISEVDRAPVGRLVANVNTLYFAGNPHGDRDTILDSDEYAIWESYGKDAPFRSYIDSILSDNESHVSLTITYPQAQSDG